MTDESKKPASTEWKKKTYKYHTRGTSHKNDWTAGLGILQITENAYVILNGGVMTFNRNDDTRIDVSAGSMKL